MVETSWDFSGSRRGFLKGAVLAAGAFGFPSILKGANALTLPALPYPENALDPVISARTIGFHYGKHHKGYLDKLNELVAGKPLADLSLEDIVKKSAAEKASAAIFNNAAQVWNHTFYWNGLKPKGGGKPAGALAASIEASFGGFDGFKKELTDAAMGQFGSGWAWLVLEAGKLKIVKTPNAETPLTMAGMTPLLTIDVWEHAYYLDYQNRRKDYTVAVIDSLLNWDFATANFEKAVKTAK